MQTRIVKISEIASKEAQEAIADAAKIIKNGGLVAFPTETVYGLGADAYQEAACAGIYEAKGRPSDNPLIVHIAETDAVLRLTDDRDPRIKALAEAFWPGPLTVIVKRGSRSVPKTVTGGRDTVAVRFPAHPVAQALIRAAGGFIAAPSANRSGRPSPTSAAHVTEDLNGRVGMILDGGDTEVGMESTIIDLTTEPPGILRPGMIGADAVQAVLDRASQNKKTEAHTEGKAAEVPAAEQTESKVAVAAHTDGEVAEALAPGMKYTHYAPKGEMTVVCGNKEQMILYINQRAAETDKITGVISSAENAPFYKSDVILSPGSGTDGREIAQHLYAVLREMDTRGAEVIFCEDFSGADATGAIGNRLQKASGGRRVMLGADGEITEEK